MYLFYLLLSTYTYSTIKTICYHLFDFSKIPFLKYKLQVSHSAVPVHSKYKR